MKIATPKVTLIASTTVHYDDTHNEHSWEEGVPLGDMEIDAHATAPEDLIEFAGRACYQSFHKPNDKTRANKDYIANIIRQGHGSVLEHASATFYIEGVSRALTHELIRHRHLNYSEVSQRFVNVEEAAVVVPPAVRGNPEIESMLMFAHPYNQASYQVVVKELTEAGYPRKQAREAARAVMPNMLETKIVVTGNLRAWRDVLGRRLDPAADAEIREVSQMILAELKKVAPAVFADFEEFE